MTQQELDRLALAVRNPDALVEIVVSGCAYSCCGRGWVRRDGYEQVYSGWVDNLKPPETLRLHGQAIGTLEMAGTFMLYADGVGTLSYVVAVRFGEVIAVGELGELRGAVC